MDIFDKFDKIYNKEDLQKEIKEAQESNGDYKEVPLGTYEVKIEKLEGTESKTNKPMVTVWFKILEGEYKNNYIFMNQLVDAGFKLNIINEFLKSLDSGIDVYFDGFKNYKNLLLDIHEAIDGKLEYLLEYKENKKGYKQYTIKEVFEV